MTMMSAVTKITEHIYWMPPGPPDRPALCAAGVLFLGDCMYDSPDGVLTAELAFPLHDAILRFDAKLYVGGHDDSVLSRADIESLIEKMRLAESAVREGLLIAAADEDMEDFSQAFRAGFRGERRPGS
jgi:hypothetical protein